MKWTQFVACSGMSWAIFQVSPIYSITFEDAVFPELATSGRALAMGNAFICKVDDSSSVFYNPAGLGTVRWKHLHLTNIHLETNKTLIRATSGGNLTKESGNFTQGFSIQGNRKLLLKHRGEVFHNRFHALPNITTRYISMGYLVAQRNRSAISLADDAVYEFASRLDHGPYVALNMSLFGGVIKLGASAIHLNRKEIIDERDRDTVVEIEDDEYKKGSALIATLGSRLTLPIAFLPTFSAVMHNALSDEFSINGAGAPNPIKKSIDLGFSLTPQIGQMVRMHLEFNYKDFSNEYSAVSMSRKLLFGLELDIFRHIFIRVGYGDGFGSAGIGMRSKRLEFDLTTYAVDNSAAQFRGKEDRRFSMTLSSGF